MAYRFFILFFTIGMVFTSCSNDDDTSDGSLLNSVELPENVLGTYTGVLEGPEVSNELGTGTLVKADNNSYIINFSDGIASIIDIEFVDLGNGTSFIQTDTDRGFTISVGFEDTEAVLSVIKSSDPIVFFGGFK